LLGIKIFEELEQKWLQILQGSVVWQTFNMMEFLEASCGRLMRVSLLPLKDQFAVSPS
jgi:hypothetical protein